MTSIVREMAARREKEWLEKHGAHEYEEHDLLGEALEELADAYNYLYRGGDIHAAAMVANIGDHIYQLRQDEAGWHE